MFCQHGQIGSKPTTIRKREDWIQKENAKTSKKVLNLLIEQTLLPEGEGVSRVDSILFLQLRSRETSFSSC
jgi:hypothetical protein